MPSAITHTAAGSLFCVPCRFLNSIAGATMCHRNVTPTPPQHCRKQQGIGSPFRLFLFFFRDAAICVTPAGLPFSPTFDVPLFAFACRPGTRLLPHVEPSATTAFHLAR